MPYAKMGNSTSAQRKPIASSTSSAPGTVKAVLVETSFYYTDERAEQWDAHSAARTLQNYHRKTRYDYVYRLELDAKGNTIGGSWEGNRYPQRADCQDRPKVI